MEALSTEISSSNRAPKGALSSNRAWRWIAILTGVVCAASVTPSSFGQNAYLQRNLVSDLPGVASVTDTNLVNPWGIAFSATSPFWIADNHSGLSTLYTGDGTPQSLIVSIPSPAGLTPLGAPTGMVFNNTTNFTVGSNAPARFIFSTEDGTIVGWNAGASGVVKVDNSASNAVYKGLAIATSGGATYIYATDFHNGRVDVFDSNYDAVAFPNAFLDPTIPAGFAPFGIQAIGNQLYVSYAMQDTDKVDDVSGPGHGYIDIFSADGQLQRQLIATGVLNSPWGMALAPVGFGPFGGALLVGNFGDGVINAFDATTGSWFGWLNDTNGAQLQIAGLWGLAFGNGSKAGDSHTLYFTAGIPGPGVIEDHGLFGSVSAVFPALTTGASYLQHNLVSDIAGLADHTDTNLVNPWGISFSSASPFWIADNHSGLSTLYNGTGTPQSLIVTIPPAASGTPPGSPTGTIFNNTTGFAVNTNGPTRFIFSTEDGTISGWNAGNAAVLKVDNSASGAVYKGLAAGSSGSNNYLYATDFHGGKVDAFDSSYAAALAGNFADATIPAGFAPFGIQNINGQIYVTYAKQDVAKHDDEKGPGNGFVNVFDTSGQMIKRFASQGVLNSPWGVALAPKGFGAFAGALLIGNFGDGRINAFDPTTGIWMGTVNDTNGSPFSVDGLWGIAFGNGANGGDLRTLYFTAGLNGEADGLFGSLAPVAPAFVSAADAGLVENLAWSGGAGPFLLQKKADLSESNWVDVLTTGNRSMPVVKDTAAGLLRVVAQTSKTVLPFSVLLSGAAEFPVVDTPGTAIGSLALEGSNLTYNINFSGLSAPATAAHIHAPASATNSAGVAVPFSAPPATSGTISGTVALTLDQVAAVASGNAYVNIHTTNHQGGEIRGQIVPLHIPVTINGASQVPPVQTPATGSAVLTLVGNELFYSVTFSGLTGPATGAHIHAPADDTHGGAPVVIPFSPPAAASGTFSGSVSLDPTNLAYILAGQAYINIHTATNAGGEIRGQIYPLQFNASLNSAAEHPATSSSGTGTASMHLVNGVLSYNLSFTNLLSAATAAHIHGPADSAHDSGVIIPFSPPAASAGNFSGSATLSTQQLLEVISGLTYVNIHTTNYGGGEIRGQVMPNN